MGDAVGHAFRDAPGDNIGLAVGESLGYALGLVIGSPSARSLVVTPD